MSWVFRRDENRLVCKQDAEYFEYPRWPTDKDALGQLLDLLASGRSIDLARLRASARHPDASIAAAALAEGGLCLVEIDIESNCHPLVVVKGEQAKAATEIAARAGVGLALVAGTRKRAPKTTKVRAAASPAKIRAATAVAEQRVEQAERSGGLLTTQPLDAVYAARASYALGDDEAVRAWLFRASSLHTKKMQQRVAALERAAQLPVRLRVDWHELEVLGGAYLVGDLDAFAVPYETHGFGLDGKALYRHWGFMGARGPPVSRCAARGAERGRACGREALEHAANARSPVSGAGLGIVSPVSEASRAMLVRGAGS